MKVYFIIYKTKNILVHDGSCSFHTDFNICRTETCMVSTDTSMFRYDCNNNLIEYNYANT